jgi:hypothetical protein
MKNKFLLVFLITTIICSCNSKNKNSESLLIKHENSTKNNIDSVAFSFTFLGCNRVDREDIASSNTSTANLSAIKRIWTEIADLKRKPDLFFFLGDMVLAETDTINLKKQLIAWKKLYADTTFSTISEANIEMVAIPGNHEMLYWHKYKNAPNHEEWPLVGATQVWMKQMNEYMPKDRDYVQGKDSINNQMTFSFTRRNIGFVLMNTDTYNGATSKNTYGLEGQIPTQWIIDKIEEYRKDANIDHVFVLGHKPYYVSGKPQTGHMGFPEGPVLWPKLVENKVVAMLSAHLHDYQRMQPENHGTYQVIAGNSGSPGSATFFGYTKIDIMSSGLITLTAMGYDKGSPYYEAMPNSPSTVRDQTNLTWSKNKNLYPNSK